MSPCARQITYKRAVLLADVERGLAHQAIRLFERLDCRDYARIDFRADANGRIKLLEVNPNPGWCWDGKLNIMAGFAGLRYLDLLRLILQAAERRLSLGHAVGASSAGRLWAGGPGF
jgi:D-alanine-D-alanine ligase